MLDSCSSFNEIIACPQAKLWKPFGKMDTESSHAYKTKKATYVMTVKAQIFPKPLYLFPRKPRLIKPLPYKPSENNWHDSLPLFHRVS